MALPWTENFLTLTIKAFLLCCLQSNSEAKAISGKAEFQPSLLLEQTGQKSIGLTQPLQITLFWLE